VWSAAQQVVSHHADYGKYRSLSSGEAVKMSPRRQLFIAVAAFVGLLILFAALAVNLNNAWAIAMFGVAIVFAIWYLGFSCPKCSTPYLWEMSGIVAIPLSFPRQCRKCGATTNIGAA
jgi:hypothetical protein